MSFEPCSDIRFKLYAEKRAKEEEEISEKENKPPAGINTSATILSGRGRGLYSLRRRLEERKKERVRKYFKLIKVN